LPGLIEALPAGSAGDGVRRRRRAAPTGSWRLVWLRGRCCTDPALRAARGHLVLAAHHPDEEQDQAQRRDARTGTDDRHRHATDLRRDRRDELRAWLRRDRLWHPLTRAAFGRRSERTLLVADLDAPRQPGGDQALERGLQIERARDRDEARDLRASPASEGVTSTVWVTRS